MSPILVVDVGNTNISLGIYRGKTLKNHWRIQTNRKHTSDELGVLIRGLLRDVEGPDIQLEGVVVASVVPPMRMAIEQMCKNYFELVPMFVGPGMKTGLSIRYENAREVGADRIANAVAALEILEPPIVICDFGTATTFSIVDEQAQFLGGPIAPGLSIASEALFQHAAKLPKIELVRPTQVIGRNPVTSMQSGIYYGYVGLVEGLIDRIQKERPASYQYVATGGLASFITPDLPFFTVVDPFLTLSGLRILWERNYSYRGEED